MFDNDCPFEAAGISLANGAKILAMGPYRHDDTRIVLAKYNGMYVTWRAAKRPASKIYDCYWGHYHSDNDKAFNEFCERANS
jgi:hypothetical protein